MSEADMAAKKAEEDARLAAEAKAKAEAEAKARAEEEVRLAAEAKAKAEAEARAKAEEERLAAAAKAKAELEVVEEEAEIVFEDQAIEEPEVIQETTTRNSSSTSTLTQGKYSHSHGDITHSHENTGEHVHLGESAVTGSASAETYKKGKGAYTHTHEGIGEHSHDNDGPHTHSDVTSDPFGGMISGIQFKTSRSAFTAESFAIMDNAVEVLKQNPNMHITIEGHTDSMGSREPNRKLSQRRAEKVKYYLISKGISASRLTAIGYGESRPVADNRYEEGRAKNRRVEFIPSYK